MLAVPLMGPHRYRNPLPKLLLHQVPRLLLYPAERCRNILRAIYPTQLDGKNHPPLALLSPLAAEEQRAQHRVASDSFNCPIP